MPHISAAPPAARPGGLWGSRAASGPEELLDSERELRVVACTFWHRRRPRGETILGSRAASGPRELRDSERTYASTSTVPVTHAYLGTGIAGRGTRKGTQ
jgi:hypothetical protein